MTGEAGKADQRLRAVVHGRVQGVGFRHATARRAEALSLTGWVRNRWDGTVETVAEGPRAALDQFVAWLNRGPSAAYVSQVERSWHSATGEFDRFRITY